jgi:hypothetical protein
MIANWPHFRYYREHYGKYEFSQESTALFQAKACF